MILRFWRIYAFWGLWNSFLLFSWWCMYACVNVYVWVCVWVNTIASKRYIRLSSSLVYILQVDVRRTLMILVIFGSMVFFYNYSYTIRTMELIALKYSSVQMVHSIVVKFGMYIISHRSTNCIEFGELRINIFFTGTQKRILMHYSLWSQIIRNMLMSKRCFWLSSNLMSSL